jgi:type IX secretion system PorP/SprF family membrane protein
MNRLQTYLSCLFIGLSSSLLAQQLSLFTQYRENQTIINPAAVGADFLAFGNNLAFGASYRAQWQGIDNAPTTSTLRGDLLFDNGGAVSLISGGYLINDQTGPTGFTGLYGRIGGLLADDPAYGGISVGLSFGAVQYRVDASEIRLRDDNDILGAENRNKIFPDVGVGVFAYTLLDGGIFNDDYIYGGISVPQVVGLDLTFQTENGEFLTQRVQHFYGMLGLYKFLRNDGFLEPSLWVKYAPNAPVNLDFNLRYQMAQNFWIGAGGATSNAMHLEAGVLLGENLGFGNTLKVGYGFDYSFNTFGPYTGGSHEINISYSLEK